MTDHERLCDDSFTIVDSYSRIVAYIKNIEESGLVPASTLYPNGTLIPGGTMALYDVCINQPTKKLPESFILIDVIGPYDIGKRLQEQPIISDILVNNVIKQLDETGLKPEDILYPNNDLFPFSGIQLDDTVAFGFYRFLVDSFGCIDTDEISSFGFGKYLGEPVHVLDSDVKLISKYINELDLHFDDIQGFGFHSSLIDNVIISDVIGNIIGKNLNEPINILDIILFSIGSYLEENVTTLDGILKGEYKSLSEDLTIEDNIVRHIISVLSEYAIINDEIETILRTLVRATLRAIKTDQNTLRAI